MASVKGRRLSWRNPLRLVSEQERVAGEWGDSSIPSWSSVSLSSSGTLVTHDSAMAISTVAQAVRQPSVIAAGLPFDVYDVSPDRKQRTLATGKWQNDLLDYPDEMRSGFDFWSDLHTHLNGYANAFAFKFKVRGRVQSMMLLAPDRVLVEVDKKSREKRYYWQPEGGGRVELPAGNVLHIRGWDDAGRPQARSPIARHRDAIGKTKSRSEMEDRFLANDARPGVIFKMPHNVTRAQAEEMLELIDARHRNNPGKPIVIGRGAEITTLPVSFRDAQFVESEEFSVTDIARVFDWPAELLGKDSERSLVELITWAVRFHFGPRLQRVEDALAADQDLFGRGSKFRPYHDTTELLRGDVRTMGELFHNLRQVGMITANEGRLPLGFPPHPDGDELLATPVGGAPNPDQPAPEAPAPPETEPA